MRVGSLFAGIGGFDLAAERAGMDVAWQSETDKHASEVLAHRFPEITNYGDIHDINPTAVDVLTGGFPCQDYSVAGLRGGLAGDRGALWWEYHRLIADIRPTWVIGENVPGLISSRGGADFETIIASLTELGYGVVWAVLDAQYFGVAQRRRRVFIVGHSGGIPRPEILALSEGLFGHPAPSRETREGNPGPTPVGVGGSSELGHTVTTPSGGLSAKQNQFIYVVEPEWGQGADLVTKPADIAPALSALNGQMHDRGIRVASTHIQTGKDWWRESDIAGTLSQRDYKESTTAIAFAQNQRNELRTLDVAGSVNAERWGTAKNETLLTEPSVRRLTPLECERLQGFPDYWTDIPDNSNIQRYRQLGNAVAVPVAEWIMEQVKIHHVD